MTKTDFEKAAKEYYDSNKYKSSLECHCQIAFLAGCEHAYSIDKEIIERLEKENKELMEGQDILANDLVKAQGEIDKLHGMWEASERIRKEIIERLEKEKKRLEKELMIVREELAIADHLLKNVP